MKRAANRKSASTSRARKKAYVDDMTAKNERMKQHALILSMLPDLVLAVCRTGEMTYVSPACQWLLLHSPEDMTGANIFELVAPECHPLLRKMISDNLSRPVKSAAAAVGGGGGAGRNVCPSTSRLEGSGGGGDEDGDETDPSEDDEPHGRGKMGNHRERLQQRYRQSQGGECNGGGGKAPGPSPSPSASTFSAPKREMLRIFRGDKTTVWCESRLSVRNEKSGDSKGGAAPMPLEIILTLRTVAEGGETAVAHEFAGGHVSLPDATAPVSPPAAGVVVADAEEEEEEDEEDADEGYVEADDDGYQCEVEAEEDSNNSGSGNDFGTRRKSSSPASSSSSSKSVRSGTKRPAGAGSTAETAEAAAEVAGADPTVGREERSLSKKRQRMGSGLEEACSDKSAGDNSSTGGDTGGSTTQECSGSCGNEVDSNGEGSNNESTSKWGDGDGGGGVADAVSSSYRDCGGGSEDGDGTSEGTSAEGTDFGDDVQTAVQSLILMGGDFNKTTQVGQ